MYDLNSYMHASNKYFEQHWQNDSVKGMADMHVFQPSPSTLSLSRKHDTPPPQTFAS